MDKIKPHIPPVTKNEVLLKNNDDWLHFHSPYQLILVEKLEEVLPALREIERLIQTNKWYAAGFLSYEAAPAFDPAIRTRPGSGFPYLWFGLYPEPHPVMPPGPGAPPATLRWSPDVDRATYNIAIAKIRASIAEGQTYQVNYTMRLRAEFTGSPWDFFLHMAQNQNTQAAYIDTDRYVICSASPELFFQLDGDVITCRPMKGTTQRGRTTVEDRTQSDWLKNSEKNRAENVMIVDMIRNDIGRIAQTGTVTVPKLFEMERYSTLWQMTSTIRAKTSASLTEIMAALFPCASITGAPKVSTMKIISDLESTPRKIYTGAIGYMAPDRKAKFNVAIRTALIDIKNQIAEYGVGGGIVWDSDSTDEYAEALLKARILSQEKQSFSLFETILWTPEEGFFLEQKHLERMLDSADYFDIPATKEFLETCLRKIASSFQAPQRVRLLLDRTGQLTCEFHPIGLTEDMRPLKACLAKESLDRANVFLFHKTTRREVYENALEDVQGLDDVLLYNEAHELTEFTIGNLVVELDGRFFTPPVSCGLLAGTFRAHLLETGRVTERTINVNELARCTKIFRINSVRRWQAVELRRDVG
ncbi:MAG TPA: aminodeoxychorismate synthase component I [Anaerolineales bacterium]